VVRQRFYLDHAATSWPKPPGSLAACVEYQTSNGAASGRGVYKSGEAASDIVRSTRQLVAQQIGASEVDEIAFCSNGTQALNAAILGLLHSPAFRDSHVVTTATEHNSVLRPLQLASKSHGIRWTAVPCDTTGWVDPDDIKRSMTSMTRLVILNHVSNVTGIVQDLAAIASIAKNHDAIFMIDAAQSLGYIPLNMVDQSIGILAAPGHKGAGGMLGTGILYVRKDLQHQMEPIWIGGTGSQSDSIDGPFGWQSGVESGNSNLPSIASLKAGLQWLAMQPPSDHLTEWTELLIRAVLAQPKLKLFGPSCVNSQRLPILSITSESLSCHEMAMLLDSAVQVEARSGFHCAGMIHDYLGTNETGGTLRLSLGHTSTLQDIEAAIEGIELLGSM
jgi:cysteine desulfurase / selenocysteine lyase